MDAAREEAGRREPPFVIRAERQTGGRGRSGRTWSAQAGLDLTFTAAVGMPCPLASLPAFTLALGVALHDAVLSTLASAGVRRDAARLGLTLKWPNDLWWSGRKIAGILCETLPRPGGTAVVLAGVGLNVNSTAFPGEIGGIASSLRLAAGREVDREEAISSALAAIEGAAGLYAREGFAAFRDGWISRCSLWGRRCRVGGIAGTMHTIDGDGALVVLLPQGGRATISSGHVEMAAVRE